MTKPTRRGQRKTQHPCPRCFLHRLRCICHLIPQLDLKTRLTLVVHAKELKRTTNTGRLAVLALSNSEMCVRGQSQEALDLSHLLNSAYQPYLLYPSEDATYLEELELRDDRPVHLIVPDGNWRQASKVHTRHLELRDVPRVKLSLSGRFESEGSLRKEHFVSGMATLEAIAHAMAYFEGEEVSNRILAVYQAKLRATLEGREPKGPL